MLFRSLSDFEAISGLKCNYDKSVVLTTFQPNPEETKTITDVGFTISEKITLLGFELNMALDTAAVMFIRIKQKIINLISFWERFRLSLAGRIAIAKTFLISQINYIGCVLPCPPKILKEIQDLIDRFVCKTLKVSNDRKYLPPSQGGLGLFELTNFLSAQNCAWLFKIGRAHV